MLDLDAIRARERAAIEDAKCYVNFPAMGYVEAYGYDSIRADIPALIAEVERLRDGIGSIRSQLDKCDFISQPLLVSELLRRVQDGTFGKSKAK